ncbi:MAG: septal ring lytic transglycosylase RlpA family protein [Pseudolabrys sp.]
MRRAQGIAGGRLSVRLTLRFAVLAAAGLTLANCNQTVDPKYGVSASARVIEPGQPVPKGGGVYRVGKPYTIAGKTYTPEVDVNYRAEGMASWYGDDFHGRYTANGEIFDMNSVTAAHPTLPLPSYVRVTNLRNKRSLIVRVNDRGPYAHNRLIDLSRHSAHLLGFKGHGVAPVRVEYVGRAPLAGSDDMKLMATLRIDGRPARDGVGNERAYARNDRRDDDDEPRETAERREAPVQVASNKPYAPEFFDARPMTRIASVPAPQGRPYALGKSEPAAPPVEARPLAAPAHQPAPASVRAGLTSPVSAYAPVRYDASAGLVSGRGLY